MIFRQFQLHCLHMKASPITRAILITEHREEQKAYLGAYRPVNAKAKEFHFSTARCKCLFCANQGGKTHSGGADVISEMNGTHPLQRMGKRPPPPLQWRVCGVDFPNGIMKWLLPKFRELVDPKYLKGGSWSDAYSERYRVLTWKDGGFVEFMSYDQDLDKYGGTQRDGVWYDEEPPKAIRMENRIRLMKRHGIELFTMTPVNGCTWIYDDIYEPWELGRLAESTACWNWSLYENPFIDKAEVDRIVESCADENDVQIRVYGKFVHRTGLVYKNWRRQHPWTYNRFDIPEEWTRYVAIDAHARKNHAILLCAVSPSGERWYYDEIYKGADVDDNCDELKFKLDGVPPEWIRIDNAAKGYDYKEGVSVYDYYCEALEERGLGSPELALKDPAARLMAVRKGFKWDPKLVPERKILYDPTCDLAQPTGGPHIHICEQDCPKLLWQLARYIYPAHANRKDDEKKDAPETPRKKDDDLPDDLGYIEVEQPEFVAGGGGHKKDRRDSDDDFEDDEDLELVGEYEQGWLNA